jgi:ABC-type amino acid transport substrate-binding protein
LHLEKQNGFYFFIDRLIGWSDVIVRLSWVAALPALAGGLVAMLIAAFLISLCFAIRFGSLSYLHAKRVKRFTIPLDCDGFGIYARSAEDWRKFEGEMRSPLIVSVVATVGFLTAAVCL